MNNYNVGVRTVEFWEQVRSDYISNKKTSEYFSKFLCLYSDTFDNAWDIPFYKDIIREYANDFLNDMNYRDIYSIGTQFLFTSYHIITIDEGTNLRIEFLNYIINKLK